MELDRGNGRFAKRLVERTEVISIKVTWSLARTVTRTLTLLGLDWQA